jgi:carbonic anhydrase
VSISKRNILYIRCSDGRSQRPADIRNHCVHQIRLPGGILFPQLCAKHEGRLLKKILQEVFMFAIEIMVKLKKPDEIILASHDDCGAAADIDLDTEQVKRKHRALGERLKDKFPNIKVRVLHEKHCESGENHYGHEIVPLEFERAA